MSQAFVSVLYGTMIARLPHTIHSGLSVATTAHTTEAEGATHVNQRTIYGSNYDRAI